MTTMTIQCD